MNQLPFDLQLIILEYAINFIMEDIPDINIPGI